MIQGSPEYKPPQRNINAVPPFVEPKVHPLVDIYFRDKLRDAAASSLKDRPPLRTDPRYKELKEQLVATDIKRGVAQRFNEQQSEAVEQLAEYVEQADERNRIATTTQETQRLQGLWTATARGDFTGVRAEIAQDIADTNDAISEHRQNPNAQADVQIYDTAVAELAEWEASLLETPVEQNSRLDKQIKRSVLGLIQQRDSTDMASLNRQLKSLQQVQATVNTLS